MTVTAIKSICEGVYPEKKRPQVLGALYSFAAVGISIKRSSNSVA